MAAALCASTIVGQVTWTARARGPALISPRLGYDLRRAKVVEVGGILGQFRGPFPGDTWEYDGSSWRMVARSTFTAGFGGVALAYEVARGRLVMTLATGGSFDFETWAWDGRAWKRIATRGPLRRGGNRMVYDWRRDRIVLFGGLTGLPFADTWEWDGTRWALITTSGPSKRSVEAMAYDMRRGRVVLFGGQTPTTQLRDTWEWDGKTWRQRFPKHVPPGGVWGMAYDPFRARCVLLVSTRSRNPVAQTWEWDGTDWALRLSGSTPSPQRRFTDMTFDIARRRVVLFGGADTSVRAAPLGDTWEYHATGPATLARLGQGCAGVSLETGAIWDLPWIGDRLPLTLGPVGASGAAFALLGTSSASWRGAPLPIDLGALGAPGCKLFTGPDLVVPAPARNGAAALSIPLPNNPWLVGRHVFVQGAVLDARLNALGLATSNAIDAKVGQR